MSYFKCYQVMGLRPGATPAQVQRAYKRLALRHHPDRTAGDPDSLALFCRVTEAYVTLKRAGRIRRQSRQVEACRRCDRIAELFTGLDGRAYCADCLLHSRRRYLPLPRFETIRCAAAIVLQVLALYCTATAAVADDWRHAAAGAVFVLGAMGTLAYNVWTADVIDR